MQWRYRQAIAHSFGKQKAMDVRAQVNPIVGIVFTPRVGRGGLSLYRQQGGPDGALPLIGCKFARKGSLGNEGYNALTLNTDRSTGAGQML